MVRYSLNFVGWKLRKTVAADLRTVYTAATAEEADRRLVEFEAKWGADYSSIVQSWRRNWERVIPFFDYPAEIRKVIYTTNATGWPSSLLKFDIYLHLSPKRTVFGVGKISEIQNKSFVAHSERSLFFPEAKHIEFQQTARAIESVNMSLRKVTKSRGAFPNDDALIKLYYLALRNISKKWTMALGHPVPIQNWKAALNRFTIMFDERMPQH